MHFLLGIAVPVGQGWTHHLTHSDLSVTVHQVQKLHSYHSLRPEAGCRSSGCADSVSRLGMAGIQHHLGYCGWKTRLEIFVVGLRLQRFVAEVICRRHLAPPKSYDAAVLQAGYHRPFSRLRKTRKIQSVTEQVRSSFLEAAEH
jgi:hypothetical protein